MEQDIDKSKAHQYESTSEQLGECRVRHDIAKANCAKSDHGEVQSIDRFERGRAFEAPTRQVYRNAGYYVQDEADEGLPDNQRRFRGQPGILLIDYGFLVKGEHGRSRVRAVGELSLLGQVGDEIHIGRRVGRCDYGDDGIVCYEVCRGLPPRRAEVAEVEIKET